jgi:hypothetical protein
MSARGRMANESAEKSGGINFRREIERSYETLPQRLQQYKEDKNKGMEIPERPSKKAMELINKGKPVAFT